MRNFAFLAPAAIVMALAAPASAQTAIVTVTIGGELQNQINTLGVADVQQQANHLVAVVSEALNRRNALSETRVNLVLTDLKPNRPTAAQMAANPSLDPMASISLGGATIEGEIIHEDGDRVPVRFSWYSTNLAEVQGFTTWQDVDRAFTRFAANMVRGRYFTR